MPERIRGHVTAFFGLHPPNGVADHFGRVAVEACSKLGLDETLHLGREIQDVMGCTAYRGPALVQADIDAALDADVARRYASK